MKVAARIDRLSESATLAVAQKSRELKAQGIDVIGLGVGEPDFHTPDFIKEAAKRAIDDNYSYYSPVPGYPQLLNSIVNKLKRDNNLDYQPAQIVVSNGAKHSLANVLQSIVDPGDEVIVPAPYWVTYVDLVNYCEGVNVILETTVEHDFKITPEQLEAAITPQTKAFLFSSPSNPTGSVYTKVELQEFARIFAKYPEIIIISDEIYEHIIYGKTFESIAQFPEIRDRVVVVNGVSKSYAMTGYRIGFIAAPLWIAKACNKLQSQYTSGPNSVAQIASVAAFNHDGTEVRKMVAQFEKRRNLVLSMLAEIPGLKTSKPDGAFYVFPEASAYFGKTDGEMVIRNSDDLCFYILSKGHVGVVSGDAFGAPGCFRISYAASEEQLTEALIRIKNALGKLH
ncbi:MAG TPA: pyridoxal phosphate-dependent aminotransferase [Prolixibacteraceae bacterium]|nr:pyridoxal phosphate-dependent aminotransferase [Prolixibacteraceae bacterium]